MGPRGMSVYERQAFEFTLLTALGLTLPDHPQLLRMAVYAEAKNDLRDKRCAQAAEEINARYKISNFKLDITDSNRGRNYNDYILHDPESSKAFILKVEAPCHSSYEHRLRFKKLLDVLLEGIDPTDRHLIEQLWIPVEDFIQTNTGLAWDDLSDKRSMVFTPSCDVLKKTTDLLHSRDSGLMPRLWNHFYGMPVLRVTFTKVITSITLLDPVVVFGLAKSPPSLYSRAGRARLIESSYAGVTSIRVHNSSHRITETSLVAGISFDFPAPASIYEHCYLCYDSRDSTHYKLNNTFPIRRTIQIGGIDMI